MRLFLSVMLLLMVTQAGCVLNSEDDGFTVSGIVTDENGEPLNNITVLLGQRIDITDINGKYRFIDILPNNYAFEADPYDVSIYRFEPKGMILGVTENKKINFIGYRR